jgi:hypothetical protein
MPIAGLVTKVDLTTGSLFSEFGIDGFCTILGNTEINQLVTSNLDQLGNLVGAIRGQNGHYLFSFDNNGEISADSIALPLTYVNYEDTSYHWASFISSLDFDESGCIYSALWINGSANTSTSFESRDVCISRFCLNEQSNSVSELVSDELLIYPNPTTGKLFLSNAVSGQSIEIIGDQGQKLKRIEINNSDRFLIDLSDYRDGIYLIRTEKGISRRFIINSN